MLSAARIEPMTSSPTAASRWQLAFCASLALVVTAGCQRKQSTAATEPAAPAAVPAPAPAVTTAAGDEVPEGVLRAYVWECADGQRLVMRNLFRERAIAIDFHDGTRRLDQAVSAAGAR